MRATRRRTASRDLVVRIAEASGSSRRSWDGALKAALRSARGEVDRPIGIELGRQWADLSPRGIATYHVAVKVAYRQGLGPSKRARTRPTG